MEQRLTIGKKNARQALERFCTGHDEIVFVTGGSSYGLCGAKLFFDDFFASYPSVKLTQLVVSGANPKVEIVQSLLEKISDGVKAFVVVGGGTVIDTAKLLNLAVVSGISIKKLLSQKINVESLLPSMIFPTTAGTGAEATRFAVCYDGGVKCSVDLEAIRPSDVVIIPEFTNTLPVYQKLLTNFDAYAQAVESLWARGATDESRKYANRALALMEENNWPEASYWAGKAIDISRTTAAHALSYHLTSHYGIPHGHAVYMVFEYICRNNNQFEYIKRIPGLMSLGEFAAEKGIEWGKLIDDLFAHVNLARLGNNPVEVRKESFNV